MALNEDTVDSEIISRLEEAMEAIRAARLKISDASICISQDPRGERRHGHADRELLQVQSHLQLAIIQLDEIGDDYRAQIEEDK